MSNHLAVATVTAALCRMLQVAANHDAPAMGAGVANLRPNTPADQLPSPGINVFLYQVTPSRAGRNADLPTRRADGQVVQRPRAALELHYLLSFHGKDGDFEPQILLASAVRALHEKPVLDRSTIELVKQEVAALAFTDLADAVDLVRFTPAALSLEEMSKLWSVFFQTPYALSVAYQASLVFVDAQIEEPAPALPVKEAELVVVPAVGPIIEAVLVRPAPGQPATEQPILAGQILVLMGRALGGDVIRVPSPVPGGGSGVLTPSDAAAPLVRIDGIDAVTSAATDSSVDVPIPAGLSAGPHTVRVLRRVPFGTPPSPHPVLSSNEVGFLLCPMITPVLGSASIHVTFSPALAGKQKVALLLNRIGGPAKAYRIDAPAGFAPGMSLDFPLPENGIESGEYLVRVLVDGAESPVGPSLTVGP
jgi:hypothetical protein